MENALFYLFTTNSVYALLTARQAEAPLPRRRRGARSRAPATGNHETHDRFFIPENQ